VILQLLLALDVSGICEFFLIASLVVSNCLGVGPVFGCPVVSRRNGLTGIAGNSLKHPNNSLFSRHSSHYSMVLNIQS